MEMKWERENIVFETLRESEVWADSKANKFYGGVITGYITPDYKKAYALAFLLAEIPQFSVRTKKEAEANEFVYKVRVNRE
jgi:hypothetical protein